MTEKYSIFLIMSFILLTACSGKSKRILEEANEQKNALLVMDAHYIKYQESIAYLINVSEFENSYKSSPSTCTYYYQYAKENFVNLKNDIEKEKVTYMEPLLTATSNLISLIDLMLDSCNVGIDVDNQTKHIERLIHSAIKSEEEFLAHAADLISIYNQTIDSYNHQVLSETKKKLFWANVLTSFTKGYNQYYSQKTLNYGDIKNQSNFMCQEAISSRNSGGIDTSCSDMDFMLRESIKQGNTGGIDIFGSDLDFMCREAIKSGDRGRIMVHCN